MTRGTIASTISTLMGALQMDKKPEIVVFAGPNGSGKSTFTSAPWIVGAYINADDMVAEQGITNEEAAVLADDLRDQHLAQRDDFTFETVLSTPRKLDFLQKAKAAGYFIRGYFILTATADINVARVNIRVRDGGHDVSEDKIRSRYQRSLKNLPAFLQICDICHVYDNTDEPFRIIRKHKQDISFFENEFWNEALITELAFGSPESE